MLQRAYLDELLKHECSVYSKLSKLTGSRRGSTPETRPWTTAASSATVQLGRDLAPCALYKIEQPVELNINEPEPLSASKSCQANRWRSTFFFSVEASCTAC